MVNTVTGWRSFFAIELSREIQGGLRRIHERLQERVTGVRWVRAEDVHLTLKFLGEVDPDRIEGISGTVQEAVKDIGPFSVRVRGSGGFPNLKNPRIIWIGVEDPSGLLRGLQERVELSLERLGFMREDRAYKPHLTLARLRPGTVQRACAEALTEMGDSDLGAIEVREIALFRSQLKPTGAEYTKLRSIPLSAP